MRTGSLLGVAAACWFLGGEPFGCASQLATIGAPVAVQGQPIRHRFPLPDGRSVGIEELAGRYTIILFLTTYDTVSQAIARRLEEMRHVYVPRINVLAVALEPPQNAPLVSVYAQTVSLGYSVALADQDTLDGNGPFGDVRAVPALALLDPMSRLIRRGTGVSALGEIESTLEGFGVRPQK